MQHRNDPDPHPYCLMPVTPGSVANFRRWNIVFISLLAILVLGFLVVAVVPHPPSHPAFASHPSVHSKVS